MRSQAGTRIAVLMGLAFTGLALLAGPAAASCAPPPPMEQAIEEAKTVFVGTVESLADEGHHATVRVEEVWKGPDLPPVVEVRGSPGGDGGMQARTSVDRTYTDDTKYLFVLYDETLPLEDNVCSRTSEWTQEHAQYRPAQVRHPVSAPNDGAGSGEVGITSTGGEADGGEPVVPGEGSGEPISYGPDGETDEELADNSGMVDEEVADNPGLVDGEPAAATGGVDNRVWMGMVIGLVALLAAARWLRRDA